MSAKKKTAPAATVYDRKCIFVGRRLGVKGTYWKFLLLPEKTELNFGRIKGVRIGATYECRKDQISTRPKRIYGAAQIDNPEWDAADALVDAENAKKNAERKLAEKESPALKAAIAAMKPLMRGLGIFDREALIKYLADKTRK